MGRSAGALTGLDGDELLHAWEAAGAASPVRRAAAVLNAVLTDLPVDAELLPIGSCDTLLLALRVGTFGPRLSGVTSCPQCGADVDLDVDAEGILASLPAVDSIDPEPDPVRQGEWVARFRLPTTADLAACADADEPAERILVRCTTSVTRAGVPVDSAAVPEHILAAVADALAVADRAADLRLRAECPACAAEHSSRLDIGEFFIAELTAAAQALLVEIDELASRYGWSEAQILAMTPTRRRSYLELR